MFLPHACTAEFVYDFTVGDEEDEDEQQRGRPGKAKGECTLTRQHSSICGLCLAFSVLPIAALLHTVPGGKRQADASNCSTWLLLRRLATGAALGYCCGAGFALTAALGWCSCCCRC